MICKKIFATGVGPACWEDAKQLAIETRTIDLCEMLVVCVVLLCNLRTWVHRNEWIGIHFIGAPLGAKGASKSSSFWYFLVPRPGNRGTSLSMSIF